MMVDVHIKDGQTILRLTARGQVVTLIRRSAEKLEEERAIRCWIDRGRGDGFENGRVQYLSRSAIAWVEQILPPDRNEFLREHAPEFLEQLLAREAAAKEPTPDPTTNTPRLREEVLAMMRQVAELTPEGRTVLRYVDCGPRSAVPGHGRPMLSSKFSTGGGSQQMTLKTDAGRR